MSLSVDGEWELNINNWDSSNPYGNSYTFKFNNQVPDLTDMEIGLTRGALYYSWNNVSSALNNNTFQLTWPVTTQGPFTWSVTVPDGIYQISDLSNIVALECQRYGFYTISSSSISTNVNAGVNIFYLSLQSDAPLYRVVINSSVLPQTSAGITMGTYSTGSGPKWPGFTGGIFNPQITFPVSSFNTNFGGLVGFTGGAPVPSSSTIGNSSTAGNLVPEISPQNIIYANCNLVYSPYTQYSSSLYSFQVSGYNAGQSIVLTPQTVVFKKVTVKNPTYLQLSFWDQNGAAFRIQDPANFFTVAFRKIRS